MPSHLQTKLTPRGSELSASRLTTPSPLGLAAPSAMPQPRLDLMLNLLIARTFTLQVMPQAGDAADLSLKGPIDPLLAGTLSAYQITYARLCWAMGSPCRWAGGARAPFGVTLDRTSQRPSNLHAFLTLLHPPLSILFRLHPYSKKCCTY